MKEAMREEVEERQRRWEESWQQLLGVQKVLETIRADCIISWQRTRTTQSPVRPRRPPWGFCECLWLVTEGFTASACAHIQSQLVNDYERRCTEDIILSSSPLSLSLLFYVLFNPLLLPLFLLQSLMALWDRLGWLVAQTVLLPTGCFTKSKSNKLGPIFSVVFSDTSHCY